MFRQFNRMISEMLCKINRYIDSGFTVSSYYYYGSVEFDDELLTKKIVLNSIGKNYLVQNESSNFILYNRLYSFSFEDVNARKVKLQLVYLSYRTIFLYFVFPMFLFTLIINAAEGKILSSLFGLSFIILFIPAIKYLNKYCRVVKSRESSLRVFEFRSLVGNRFCKISCNKNKGYPTGSYDLMKFMMIDIKELIEDPRV